MRRYSVRLKKKSSFFSNLFKFFFIGIVSLVFLNLALNLGLPPYLSSILSSEKVTINIKKAQVNFFKKTIILNNIDVMVPGTDKSIYTLSIQEIFLPITLLSLNQITFAHTAQMKNFDFTERKDNDLNSKNVNDIEIKVFDLSTSTLKQYRPDLYETIDRTFKDILFLHINPLKMIQKIFKDDFFFQVTIPNINISHYGKNIGNFQNCDSKPKKQFPCVININTKPLLNNEVLKFRLSADPENMNLDADFMWNRAHKSIKKDNLDLKFKAQKAHFNIKANFTPDDARFETHLDFNNLNVRVNQKDYRLPFLKITLKSKSEGIFEMILKKDHFQKLQNQLIDEKTKSFSEDLKKKIKERLTR